MLSRPARCRVFLFGADYPQRTRGLTMSRGQGEEVMNRREFNTSLIAGATLVAAPRVARSQTVYDLKLGHFISPTHIFAVYLDNWTKELKEKSEGRLNVTIFPANTMGPVQNYADYARTGVADITWFLHGATPGRFPLT